MRTYLGHFTNLCKFLLGGIAPPIPNCFGFFSKSGFTTFSGALSFFPAEGAGAGALADFFGACSSRNTDKMVHFVYLIHPGDMPDECKFAQQSSGAVITPFRERMERAKSRHSHSCQHQFSTSVYDSDGEGDIPLPQIVREIWRLVKARGSQSEPHNAI